jgi:endogenous inhibitor of DNA gyrase (YacG/DUF329 family)
VAWFNAERDSRPEAAGRGEMIEIECEHCGKKMLVGPDEHPLAYRFCSFICEHEELKKYIAKANSKKDKR